MEQFVMAIVGRPNVGKSTLFNRLSTRAKAIVYDTPGVTRDRKYTQARLGGLEFMVVDTPGFESAKENTVQHAMTQQALEALVSADVICFVVDGVSGTTSDDATFASILRRYDNVILVVNKCEGSNVIDKSYYRLGFAEPVFISAQHGLGMLDLCEALIAKTKHLPQQDVDATRHELVEIAVVGRPNAGKSTFINTLIGEDRLLAGPTAGITRDAISVQWEFAGRKMKLVDTAGMRKRAVIDDELEKLAVADSLHAIRFANVVVLMVDATLGLQQQDLNIANLVIAEGRCLVLAMNKWDLIQNKKLYKAQLGRVIEEDLSYVAGLPVVYTCSMDKSAASVMEACVRIYDAWNVRHATSLLNRWLRATQEIHKAPLVKGGKKLNLKYITQIKSRPPTFKVFTNFPEDVPATYTRYLINCMRKDLDMPGVPIRISFTASHNPYAKK